MTKSCIHKHPRFRIPRFCITFLRARRTNITKKRVTEQVPEQRLCTKSDEPTIKTNLYETEHRYVKHVHKLKNARQEQQNIPKHAL